MTSHIPKPRISKTLFTGWSCHDDYYTTGFGRTPALAYLDWMQRHLTVTRIPRTIINNGSKVGYWNRKAAYRWWAEGCKPIRSYIGRRQIIGYDPATDELILRGKA